MPASSAIAIFTAVCLILLFMTEAALGILAICDRLEDIARAVRDERERKPHA